MINRYFCVVIVKIQMNMEREVKGFFGADKSILLLISLVAFVFIFPIIDNKLIHDFFASMSYIIVILSIFSIVERKSKFLSYLLIIAVIANIIMYFGNNEYVRLITFFISIFTFLIATVVLIQHISISKNVTIGIVIQAISGYLLIGIIGVLINTIVLVFDKNAIDFSITGNNFSSIIYYSFITLTTIGYGEIVPQSVTARSVSIFIGVAGQIYLTVVIALIIGKFISSNLRK